MSTVHGILTQASADEGFAAIVVAPAGMRAFVPDANVEVGHGCATRDGDALVPAWVV